MRKFIQKQQEMKGLFNYRELKQFLKHAVHKTLVHINLWRKILTLTLLQEVETTVTTQELILLIIQTENSLTVLHNISTALKNNTVTEKMNVNICKYESKLGSFETK